MNSNNIIINAYKGLFYNFFLDLRNTAFIGIIIALSMVAFDLILALIFINISGYSSNDGSGVLFVGPIVMLVALIIHVISSTSLEGIHSKFTFPINRTIYAVSNFIFMIFGSFLLLVLLTIIAPVEILIFRFIELLTDKLLFVNSITLNSYFIGFVSSWAYLLAFASLTYVIFMYVRKYTLYTLPVISLIIASIFMFGWFGNIMAFLFLENNLGMLLLKLLSITVISHLLGFIPLKRLEVQ